MVDMGWISTGIICLVLAITNIPFMVYGSFVNQVAFIICLSLSIMSFISAFIYIG